MQLTGTRKTLKRRIDALRRESTSWRSPEDARLGQALSDPYRWATEYTQTYNEHWQEEGRPSPYESFPQRLPYLEPLFQVFTVAPREALSLSEESLRVPVISFRGQLAAPLGMRLNDGLFPQSGYESFAETICPQTIIRTLEAGTEGR